MSAYDDNHVSDYDLMKAPMPRAPRSYAWLAWLVIVLVVGAVVVLRQLAGEGPPPSDDDRLVRRLTELEYRLLIGATKVLKEKQLGDLEPAVPPPKGTVMQRLYHIVLAGEIAGPEEARRQLDGLDRDLRAANHKPTPAEERLRDILTRLYRDYARGRLDRPSLTAADRTFLRAELGWFGALALAPPGPGLSGPVLGVAGGCGLAAAFASDRDAVLAPAEETFTSFAGIVSLLLLLGLAGLLGLIVMLVMAASGKVRSRLELGTGHGGIYAETFAIWLILFGGLSVAIAVLSRGQDALALAIIPFGVSLLALAWPVQRGIPWTQVRRDVGLTLGENPPFEPIAGITCYILALPLVALGIIVMLVLVYFQANAALDNANPFTSPGVPSHPAVEPLAFGSWESRVMILFLAAGVAPFVEEIMFRGVLYRHLREASRAWGAGLSIVFSGTVAGFIFAVLHPQGLVTVPVLMALAYGFTIAREWRGTLVPCMVGHCISNALVMLLVLGALAD